MEQGKGKRKDNLRDIMMKTLLFFLLLCSVAWAQDGTSVLWKYADVTLDSNSTSTLYLGFEGSQNGTQGFSTSAINPYDVVRLKDNLFVYGYIDSTNTAAPDSNHTDSLAVQIDQLDYQGYLLPGGAIYLDFANNDSAAALKYNDWTPFNASTATLGSSSPTFGCNLTNLLLPGACGLKFTFTQVAIADTVTAQIDLVVVQGKQDK